MTAIRSLVLALSLAAPCHVLAAQQVVGDAPVTGAQPGRLLLRYATFDPTTAAPQIAPALRGGPDTHLWLVQFHGVPSEADRAALRRTGAVLCKYMPQNAYVVRMDGGQRQAVAAQPRVRWIGHYEPAYRLEPALVAALTADPELRATRYNILMVDKRADKAALAAHILALGGTVVEEHPGSPLFTVDLDGRQLAAAARLDEVLWIDRWTPSSEDMDNARMQGGGDYVESVGGYTGAGIRGHVYEGVEFDHPDFNTAMTNVLSSGSARRHGHCTAGIIFGNGSSHSSARGMAPDAVGFYTTYTQVNTGVSRNQVIDTVVNTHDCMFTTASWGAAQTTAYTSVSADADDIVFDHRIPWTQSQSNLGDQRSRPEAWGKNIISVGGVDHFDNSLATDDSWAAGNASTGPAADGRIKPDLCAYYDQIHTSDLTGSSGYNTASGTAGNHYTGFGGTSGATPIVAGHNALAIQMYTDRIFNNPARVNNGSRFENRPYAQTLKALMIVGATQYPFTALSTDNRREHQGWGFPDLGKLYDRRGKTLIVPEEEPIRTSEVRTYGVTVPPGEAQLEVCLTWLEPMGNPAAAQQLINDLSLRVTAPNGAVFWGNHGLDDGRFSTPGGSADHVDSVECVIVPSPIAGQWRIEVLGESIVEDAHLDTSATDATFALVAQGGVPTAVAGCGVGVPNEDPGGSPACNYLPFGQSTPHTLTTLYARNNGGSVGGAVYFDVTVANTLYLHELAVNTGVGQGNPVSLTVYRTPIGGSYAGNETNPAAWSPVSHGSGVAEATDEPTNVALDHPIRLTPGSYGLAIVANDFDHEYTNGPAGGQSFGDANLTVDLGSATNTPFSGSPFSPRTANITLGYRTAADSWTNVVHQSIMRSAMLGGAGQITGLSFAPCGTGMHWNDTLRIRMAHVPAGTTLSTTFAANLPSPVTVLDAQDYNWPVVQDQWNEIGLQQPFAYDGISDVVVEVLATGNTMSLRGGSVAFRREAEPRVYAYGWTGVAPLTGTAGNSAPKMRVQFGCADASVFGRSCGGLRAETSGDPVLGANWTMLVRDALPGSLVFQRLGFDSAAPTYPFDLTGFGLPECYLFHDNIATNLVVADPVGEGGFALAIPSNPTFVGTRFYGQWLNLNGGVPGGLSVSEYVRILVGTP